MLIRRLEFSGIGPFAGRHAIDFDALTAPGVFLIEGPTGSGKSTIIDAIVFALYGGVAGKDSTDKRMRSSHAELTSESWVDAVFSVSSGTYRVRRTPAYDRAKKRGDGVTHVAASATLWRLSEAAIDAGDWDAGEPIATQARETSEMLTEIVGMSKQQFVQTVVLPQGQFADFLRLGSKDRASLLEKIFRTANFREFAQVLRDRAAESSAAIEAAFAHYSAALAAWLGNSAISSEACEHIETLRAADLASEMPSSAEVDAALLSSLREECTAAAKRAKTAGREREVAEEKMKNAETALTAGIEITKALAQLEQLLAERADLEAQAPHIAQLQEKISAHQQAAVPLARIESVVTAMQRAAQAGAAIAQTAENEAYASHAGASEADTPTKNAKGAQLRNVAAQFEELNAIDPAWSVAEAQLSAPELTAAIGAAEAEAGHVTKEIGAIEAMLAAENQLVERQKQAEQRRSSIAELGAKLEHEEQALAKLPEDIAGAEAALKAAQMLATKEEKLVADLAQIEQLHAAALKHQTMSNELACLRGELDQALAAHAQAKAVFDTRTEQWVASAAAHLAGRLEPATPCPVCGSLEHPAPAQPTESHTSKDEVDAAQLALEAARNAMHGIEEKIAAAAAALSELEARIGDEDSEHIEARAQAVQAEIAAAKQAAAKQAELEEQVAALAAQRVTASEAVSALKEQLAAETAALGEAEATIKQQLLELASSRGTYESVAAKHAALVAQRDHMHFILQQLREAQSTLDDAALALAQLHAAIAESPFESPEQARAAALSAAALKAANAEVSDHAKALAAVTAGLARPEIARLTGAETADIEALQAAAKQAKAEYEAAAEAATLAARGASDAKRLLDPVVAASKAWHKAALEAGPISRLANLAAAGNSSLSGIPLNIWVLLKRFEIVVERANEHLARISSGRYELKRVDEASGNRKAGLDLRIIDRDGSARGDEIRETSSLSGGETFYTSLALALGLAEVVQEEQGGVRIDTLIIDEGFGTLSDDVREAVMRTLTSLSVGGRVVGIVSHVEYLKQMVPNRISTRQLPDGSSSLAVTA